MSMEMPTYLLSYRLGSNMVRPFPAHKCAAQINPGNAMEFLERNPSFPAVSFLRDIIEGLYYLHCKFFRFFRDSVSSRFLAFNPEFVHGDIKAASYEAYRCLTANNYLHPVKRPDQP